METEKTVVRFDQMAVWTTQAELQPFEVHYFQPLLKRIAGGVPHLEKVADGLYITSMVIILMGPDQMHHVEWTLTLGMTVND